MDIETSNDPDGFAELEHSGWEEVSAGYERHFGSLTRQSVDALLQAAGADSGKRLLDVCCGPGMIAGAAAALGAEVTGIDFSSAAVRIASSRVSAAGFDVGDAQSLPYPDDHFDTVVCGFGIIHLPQPHRALAEMYRVLKPGGRVALSVWETPSAANGFGLIYGSLKALAKLDVDLPHGPDFFQFSDPERLKGALLHTGFEQADITSVPQTWEFDDAHGLVSGIMEGSVRAKALISAQSADARRAVESAIDAGMEAWAGSDGRYRVPMPALIGSARK